MITFKQYLQEAQHKQELGIDEALELMKAHCKDALKLNEPLWRGMTGNGDAYTLHGEASTRRSANTTNYYTVIMDHFLPPLGYPKRSQSIILTNRVNIAIGFGRAYAIYPYDGVSIGVCFEHDLWESPSFRIGSYGNHYRIHSWNTVWKDMALDPSSYYAFVDDIQEKMVDDSSFIEDKLIKIFGTPDNVEPALEKAYSVKTLKLELATTKTIENYNDRERELWIGGKCIAISAGMWHQLKDEKRL